MHIGMQYDEIMRSRRNMHTDFITKLPVSPMGNDTLIVRVDRLPKMVIVHACKEVHCKIFCTIYN